MCFWKFLKLLYRKVYKFYTLINYYCIVTHKWKQIRSSKLKKNYISLSDFKIKSFPYSRYRVAISQTSDLSVNFFLKTWFWSQSETMSCLLLNFKDMVFDEIFEYEWTHTKSLSIWKIDWRYPIMTCVFWRVPQIFIFYIIFTSFSFQNPHIPPLCHLKKLIFRNVDMWKVFLACFGQKFWLRRRFEQEVLSVLCKNRPVDYGFCSLLKIFKKLKKFSSP